MTEVARQSVLGACAGGRPSAVRGRRDHAPGRTQRALPGREGLGSVVGLGGPIRQLPCATCACRGGRTSGRARVASSTAICCSERASSRTPVRHRSYRSCTACSASEAVARKRPGTSPLPRRSHPFAGPVRAGGSGPSARSSNDRGEWFIPDPARARLQRFLRRRERRTEGRVCPGRRACPHADPASRRAAGTGRVSVAIPAGPGVSTAARIAALAAPSAFRGRWRTPGRRDRRIEHLVGGFDPVGQP